MSLSPEQLAMRRTGIGSSDIAALAGVDKRRNAIAVYLDKKLPVEESVDAPTGWNPRRWGNKLQRILVEECAEVHGLVEIVHEPGTLRHPKIDIALASPDALGSKFHAEGVGAWKLSDLPPPDVHLIEAKAPGIREAADDWDDEQAPDGYIIQTQWQMGVTGIQRAFLCALIGGQDFRIRPITFDPELFGNLVEIAERFWTDHVLADRPPPLDHSDAAAEYLRRRFGLHPAKGMLELEPSSTQFAEAQALAEQIRWCKGQSEALENDEKAARHKLKEICGESEGILGICTSKYVQRAGYSVEPTEYRELRLARQKKARK